MADVAGALRMATNNDLAHLLGELRGEVAALVRSVSSEHQHAAEERRRIYEKLEALNLKATKTEIEVADVQKTCGELTTKVTSLSNLPNAVENLQRLAPTVDRLEGLRIKGSGVWIVISVIVVAAIALMTDWVRRKLFSEGG